MPNTNPQAVLISNTKIRPLADAAAKFYNLCKIYQAEAQAEGWSAMFVGGAGNVVADGSDVDGRTQVTDADVTGFITFIGSTITSFEASANANRNLVLKISPNPVPNS